MNDWLGCVWSWVLYDVESSLHSFVERTMLTTCVLAAGWVIPMAGACTQLAACRVFYK